MTKPRNATPAKEPIYGNSDRGSKDVYAQER